MLTGALKLRERSYHELSALSSLLHIARTNTDN